MALTQVKTSGIADDAVTLAKQAAGTDGQIITYDANGNPVAVGPGTDGQVLTSTGAGSPPAFENAASGVGGATGVDFNDDVYIRLGTGNDLKIWHNAGANSYIRNESGNLLIESNGAGADAIQVVAGGAVELFHNGTKTFETASSGVAITGNGTFDAAGSNYIRIGSTDAGGATLTLDGDSDGDGSGADYCMIKHDTDGHLKIYADNPANAADIQFYTNSTTERLRINASGYIAHHDSNIVTNGFGYHGWSGKTQILDSQGLAVYRAADAWGGALQLASSRGTYASASASQNGDRVGGVYFCAHDGTDLNNYTAAIESYVADTVASNDTPGYLSFQTASDGTNQLSQKLIIQANGDVQVESGDLILGAAGKGVLFYPHDTSVSSPGSDSNLLDDYEEGTFTPVFTTEGSAFSTDPTYSPQLGEYTKVGNLVTCNIYMGWNNAGAGGSGTLRIAGLPFSIAADGWYTGVSFGWQYWNHQGMNQHNYITAYGQNGQAYAVLLYQRTYNGSVGNTDWGMTYTAVDNTFAHNEGSFACTISYQV